MKIFKQIIGVFLGTLLLGLGVALFKIASLGQDSLSAFVFSLVYLSNEKIPYMLWYIIVNLFFLILMIIYQKDKINIGTIISLLLTGFCADMFIIIYGLFNINISSFIVKLIIAVIGTFIASFGIALYGGANLGLGPYDAIPLIISNKFKKFKYKYVRILIELIFVILAFIIGNLILERNDLIGINTLITFIFMGPIISISSKFIDKYIFKKEVTTFN